MTVRFLFDLTAVLGSKEDLSAIVSWVIIMAHIGARGRTVGYAGLLVLVAAGVHYYIGYRIPTRTTECSA